MLLVYQQHGSRAVLTSELTPRMQPSLMMSQSLQAQAIGGDEAKHVTENASRRDGIAVVIWTYNSFRAIYRIKTLYIHVVVRMSILCRV